MNLKNWKIKLQSLGKLSMQTRHLVLVYLLQLLIEQVCSSKKVNLFSTGKARFCKFAKFASGTLCIPWYFWLVLIFGPWECEAQRSQVTLFPVLTVRTHRQLSHLWHHQPADLHTTKKTNKKKPASANIRNSRSVWLLLEGCVKMFDCGSVDAVALCGRAGAEIETKTLYSSRTYLLE